MFGINDDIEKLRTFLGTSAPLFLGCFIIMWFDCASPLILVQIFLTIVFAIFYLMQLLDWNEWNVLCLSVLLSTLMVIVALRFKGKRKRLLASQIPGPNGMFLVGMLPMVLNGPEKIIEHALRVYRNYEKSLFKLWICNNLYIMLTQPEDIEFVLTNSKLQKKAKEYMVARESIMGQGIFSIDDIKKWKNHRKMVTGGLNFSMVKSFIPIFYEESSVLSSILQTKQDLKFNDCDIYVPVSMATMEIIGKTALDVTFNAQNGDRHLFVENIHKAMQAWEYRVTHPWYLNKLLFRFSSVYKQHNRSQQIINDFIDEIVHRKMKELNRITENDETVEREGDILSVRKTKTVIEILLSHYHEIPHEQIRDELVTILIGGQDTTAMTNSFAIFMLAHHQDVQNKVYEEIESIFSVGDPTRQPTYEDLQRMEYLERVIKETLRLYPAVPVIGRSLDEEMQIGKHLCPAGSSVLIVPLFLQSSSQFYADPEKFDPDNFLPDACRNRHPYAYIPFSAGYRNCVGIKYGMIQMKTTLSTLVRKNAFFPSERCPAPRDLKLMYASTLKFADGCYVKIVPRPQPRAV